jgi:hypothetical protein
MMMFDLGLGIKKMRGVSASDKKTHGLTRVSREIQKEKSVLLEGIHQSSDSAVQLLVGPSQLFNFVN